MGVKILRREATGLKHRIGILSFFPLTLLILSGCIPNTAKTESIAVIYAVAAVISILILFGYCFFTKQKTLWFILLLSSVLIVNCGYLTLALSGNLSEALLANRISYLGSVFLPMFMLMILLNSLQIRLRRYIPGVLILIGILVFLIAASPGYLDIYYKEVSFATVNGVGFLQKVYGPWHKVYLLYLLFYYAVMIGVMIHAFLKRKVSSFSHALILTLAVTVNLGVWFIEQLVQLDFEILAISYIITDLFLLCFDRLATENQRLKALIDAKPASAPEPELPEKSYEPDVDIALLENNLATLTRTERLIFDLYIQERTTKEIMAELNIKENTLKFHNKNIYGKLGVTSRKQLQLLYKSMKENAHT